MAQMRQYGTPEQALQTLMNQNPLAKQIVEFAQGRGIGLQQVAEIMAQQKNVDLAQLMKELQS